MRSSMDTLMNQIIAVFCAAQAHHAYLFTNRSANRMKVIVHDGFGVWLCARRLHKGSWVRRLLCPQNNSTH
jgi:transposase